MVLVMTPCCIPSVLAMSVLLLVRPDWSIRVSTVAMSQHNFYHKGKAEEDN